MAEVRKRIEAQPQGEVFASRSMLALGSRAAIDQSLTRLAREGTILRVARGAYVRPKESRFVGKVIPEPQETVKAMAQARGETLLVHGAEAVLRFGLTTQVPVRSLFYTSGPSRKLRVGKQEVILRHASLRLLALGSGAAAMAFSALWYMGKRQVTMATLARIQEKLSPAEFCELRKSAQLPGWLSDLFHDFEKAGPNRSRSKM